MYLNKNCLRFQLIVKLTRGWAGRDFSMDSTVFHAFVSLRNFQNNLSLKTGFRHHFLRIFVYKPADLCVGEMRNACSCISTMWWIVPFNVSPAEEAHLSMFSCICLPAVMRHSAVEADLMFRLWEVGWINPLYYYFVQTWEIFGRWTQTPAEHSLENNSHNKIVL